MSQLDYLLTVYDNSIRNNNVTVGFTREELERQYFINALSGKETVLSANNNKYTEYEWELVIVAC